MVSDRDGQIATSPSSGPRVLLAEDNDELRGILARTLRARGYRVEEAASGDQAAAALLRECPDALLSDLIMPGLSGQDVANVCHAHCPDTVLIFMSGYSSHELNAMDVQQMVYRPKPVSPAEVADTLDRLLAQRERRSDAGSTTPGVES
jgi:CheY-like chemotaxis protein